MPETRATRCPHCNEVFIPKQPGDELHCEWCKVTYESGDPRRLSHRRFCSERCRMASWREDTREAGE